MNPLIPIALAAVTIFWFLSTSKSKKGGAPGGGVLLSRASIIAAADAARNPGLPGVLVEVLYDDDALRRGKAPRYSATASSVPGESVVVRAVGSGGEVLTFNRTPAESATVPLAFLVMNPPRADAVAALEGAFEAYNDAVSMGTGGTKLPRLRFSASSPASAS